MPAGVGTIENGITYWSSEAYKTDTIEPNALASWQSRNSMYTRSDATSAQSGAIMTTMDGDPYTGSIVNGQTSWLILTGDSGQTSTGPSTTGTSSSSSLTTTSETYPTGRVTTTIDGVPWVYTVNDESTVWMSPSGDSGQTTSGASTPSSRSSSTSSSSSSSSTTTSETSQTVVVTTTIDGAVYEASVNSGAETTAWTIASSNEGDGTTEQSTNTYETTTSATSES
jgi:hypothetical protein